VLTAERRPISAGRRWPIAFGFGLIHGFGFSFALRESMQFSGSHLLTSLLSFNLGVELGQILVRLCSWQFAGFSSASHFPSVWV
jgi:hypothetical protein